MADKNMDTLCTALRALANSGFVHGPGGNASIRLDRETMAITASGSSFGSLVPDDFVKVNLETGEYGLSAVSRPSSETSMHIAIYRTNPEINVVLHTHPTYCIALSTVGDRLPILFPDQAALVGKTELLRYMLPTTEQFGEAVASALVKSNGCSLILQNHGLVVTGSTVLQAYYRTQIIEQACKIYLTALATHTKVHELSEEEILEVRNLEVERYRNQRLAQ
ncbi:class II aldolase/adducin family protein [Alicyclobacillus mali (ex Roth et al. 2021)]|uniref:class II aldolase/adducin family protein n=1 Tax=Alicyclobacillus mali (ex Roth et al. 2021) TaxID=1123961 RepID=UPI0009E7BFFB